MTKAPTCPKCNQPAQRQKTRYGDRFACCGLWSWDGKPLVSADVHKARQHCHMAVDPLWQKAPETYDIAEKSGTPERLEAEQRIMKSARGRTYRFIADKLKLPEPDVHMAGQEDVATLRQIYAAAKATDPQAIRTWAKEQTT